MQYTLKPPLSWCLEQSGRSPEQFVQQRIQAVSETGYCQIHFSNLGWGRGGHPSIDLFASHRKRKCQLFWSRASHCLGFLLDRLLYAFPSVPLLPMVVLKLKKDHACIILIALLGLTWPSLPGLPPEPRLISWKHSHLLHPNLATLHFTAWVLHGWHLKRWGVQGICKTLSWREGSHILCLLAEVETTLLMVNKGISPFLACIQCVLDYLCHWNMKAIRVHVTSTSAFPSPNESCSVFSNLVSVIFLKGLDRSYPHIMDPIPPWGLSLVLTR